MTHRALLVAICLGTASAGCAIHVHDGPNPQPTLRGARALNARAFAGSRHTYRPHLADHVVGEAPRATRPVSRAARPATETRARGRSEPPARAHEPARPARARTERSRRHTDVAAARALDRPSTDQRGAEARGRRDRGRSGPARDRRAERRGRSTDPVPPPGRPRVRDTG